MKFRKKAAFNGYGSHHKKKQFQEWARVQEDRKNPGPQKEKISGNEGPAKPLNVGCHRVEFFQEKTEGHVRKTDEFCGSQAESNPFGEKNLEDIVIGLEKRRKKSAVQGEQPEGDEKRRQERVIREEEESCPFRFRAYAL